MILRPATPDDLETLRRWDRRPHVAANAGDDGGMDWARELPRSVPWRQMLMAEAGGRPMGIVIIIDPAREETRYWGDVAPGLRAIDIWIGEADRLGRGFGTAMMGMALERCFRVPEVTAVLVDPLHANTRGRRFYERLGFRPLERRTFGPDDCMVYRLDRAGWEAAAGACGKAP